MKKGCGVLGIISREGMGGGACVCPWVGGWDGVSTGGGEVGGAALEGQEPLHLSMEQVSSPHPQVHGTLQAGWAYRISKANPHSRSL